MTKEGRVKSKGPMRLPLKQVFSDEPAVETCISCGAEIAVKRKQTLSEEIRYFPPRGIDVLALERSTLKTPNKELLEQTQKILANSPHPAVALLHQYFSNDKKTGDKKTPCEGKENSNLTAVTKLIQYLKKNNIWWKNKRWIGPKMMDVTIYIAFKYEAESFRPAGSRRKPWVLGDDKMYTKRVGEVAKLIGDVNKSLAGSSPDDSLPTNWPEVTDAGATQPYIVCFHIVPVLEDSSTLGEDRYEALAKICTDQLGGIKNVFFRRNPEDNQTTSPLLPYLETHPKDAELNNALDSIKKDQQALAVALKLVDKLTEEAKTDEDIAASLEEANTELNEKTRSFHESILSIGGHYGYVTGDCTPKEKWWTEASETRIISAAEDLANTNRKVVGVLFFDGSWQGRSDKAIPCVDKRPYSTPNISRWTKAMSLGTDRKGSDGRLVRLAATPAPN